VALGLLAEEPMHGYDLLERLRERGMDSWVQVGKASVYQALRRLEAGGLIGGRSQEGTEGPDRRVYRITRPGRDQLRRALLERFASETEAGIALGFAHVLTPFEVRRGLDEREEAVRAELDRVAADRARAAAERGAGWTVAERMLEREESLLHADLAWLVTFRKTASRLRR